MRFAALQRKPVEQSATVGVTFRRKGKPPMPTDTQIAVIVEVAQSGGVGLNSQQHRELPELIAERMIEPATEPSGKYKVTAHGQKMLDDRGVGANES
jgi:hypothetical protein